MSEKGKMLAVRDLGTIKTPTKEEANIRRNFNSTPVGISPQVSEAAYTVTGQRVYPVAGKPARSSAYQLLIQRSAANQYTISGLRTQAKRRF
jgi:hypothetical protein